MDVLPIEWLGNRIRIIDQTRLPQKEVYLELPDYQDMASAVLELKIRGAPAIGIGIAYAIALGALKIESGDRADFLRRLQTISQVLAATRPTARNLFWAIERMQKTAEAIEDAGEIRKALVDEAVKIHREQLDADRKLSWLGAELIEDGATVLTHCNTGALATGGYGTALGVIKTAAGQGKKINVLVDETRPLLQGARLTAWELQRAGIPFRLITDSMAGYFISRGRVGCIIVGADRICANGDTANKIGTYTLAVLAKEHGIPFYVATPANTIDMTMDRGMDIPIEERKPDEITHIQGIATAPEGTEVLNPAFDVTPHHLISAVITERGIISEPYVEGLQELFRNLSP
ncbi:S-methyl-5-thioribose-1-phosphate isomerase [Chloroflexota bacterium]